jgi:hypothetical protein
MERSRGDELDRLERHVGFLATVGSVSPFIGLMGTVWGVMSSFLNIGVQGSASLIVVAPGIAEALIATGRGPGGGDPGGRGLQPDHGPPALRRQRRRELHLRVRRPRAARGRRARREGTALPLEGVAR